MLASALRTSSRLQTRSLATAAAKATPAKSGPMVSATLATGAEVPSASHGELAWCEVYGMDYEKMLLEAQNEAPIALNDPRSASGVTATRAATEDIWSVVFGTSK